ncbi:MAG: hypothetical protein EOO10_16120 [Chitinophagaceae bacterium]|nr:MAG: hypothetical protein EOO10_16120 [Chitinophagaceae bacterium]
MDRQNFEERVEERWRRRGRGAEKGRIWVGLFLLVAGGLFLARESGVFFPSWFFSWPVLLIAIGIFSGLRHGFQRIGWLFPILIGSIFLFDKISPDINLRPYLWPIILIAAGLFIIFRPKRSRYCGPGGGNDDNSFSEGAATGRNETTAQWEQAMTDRNDVVDVTAVFGGVKKNLLSKTFKGGDITAVMGGAEINLTQADFDGKVMIDCFNMFGGTKLIVPPDWEVQSDVVAIFGGVDDKRPPVTNAAPNKVLYLDGTCLFGGLEIKSY